MKLYLHSPNTSSWRGAQLKKTQEQLYLYITLHYISLHYTEATLSRLKNVFYLSSLLH